ncbi:hypothetical protein [Mycobacterium sp. AT1]|uniref:hypothetical protein n=1 Tax=Mycobacterium sp. AT1 TaxID=1961706 RepID=UPI0009AC647D|nr:hypothetical protein [Mycobacterium sp. AT1]OPX08362.1 hypothetical protein B1790_19925 [Mycobacterium sp. AT1]
MTNHKPTRRLDGHTPRYSYNPADRTHWIVDAATVDGCALDSAQSDETAVNTECACDTAECDDVLAAADRLPLPNGEDLAQLICDALPE